MDDIKPGTNDSVKKETTNKVSVVEHQIDPAAVAKYAGQGDFSMPIKESPLDDLLGTKPVSAPAAVVATPVAPPVVVVKPDPKDLEKKAEAMVKDLGGKPKKKRSGAATKMALAAVLVVMMGAGGVVGMNLMKMQGVAENRSQASTDLPDAKDHNKIPKRGGRDCDFVERNGLDCIVAKSDCRDGAVQEDFVSYSNCEGMVWAPPAACGGNGSFEACTIGGVYCPSRPAAGWCGVVQVDYGICYTSTYWNSNCGGGGGEEEPDPVTCGSLTVAPVAPVLNDQVSLTCASSFPGATYKYFYSVNGGGLTEDADGRFQVTAAGTYAVRCIACDSNGANCAPAETPACNKSFTVNPVEVPSLSCTSLTSDKVSPIQSGQAVEFTCDGENEASYNFQYGKVTAPDESLDVDEWIPVAVSGVASNKAKIVFPKPGEYVVQCQACDAENSCTVWGKANRNIIN